jgi:beta-ribofuranosylaminobenzene 5'-phosphate synthase
MPSSQNNSCDLPREIAWRDCVAIQSPARLHFGLLEVCAGQDRLFGGLGAMIEQPSTQLSLKIDPSSVPNRPWTYKIDAEEPWNSRIESVLKRWIGANAITGLPSIQIRLENQPRMHAGLGSGTQIACATVSLLSNWSKTDSPIPTEKLAKITQRGKRSYVGLAGHGQGGFLVDHGVSTSGSERQIDRYDIPLEWCVVLAKPLSTATISGVVENDYFGQSQFPNPYRESMWDRIQSEIVPALQTADLNQFGSSLYEYGRDAGRVFAKVQGGIYRDQVVALLIDWIRAQGVLATGQTSWGPTVYAILGNQDDADDLQRQLLQRFPTDIEVMTTRFNHTGCYSLATST